MTAEHKRGDRLVTAILLRTNTACGSKRINASLSFVGACAREDIWILIHDA